MTRRAHGAVCRCGAAILLGDDDDACALVASVDVHRLTRSGELLAVIAGRTTYEFSDGRLYRRDRWGLRSPRTVMAAHRCGDPVPPEHRLPPAPATALPSPEEF